MLRKENCPTNLSSLVRWLRISAIIMPGIILDITIRGDEVTEVHRDLPSRQGESHPKPLTERSVNLSIHSALVVPSIKHKTQTSSAQINQACEDRGDSES
jgi:hypothetical protein